MILRRLLVVVLALLGFGPAGHAAPQAMVAAAHPLAVEAGLDVLRRGGSAVDAAIAVQMVLGVVEPQASGIGGGGFLLHYDAATQAIAVYDGRETAPAGATPDDVPRRRRQAARLSRAPSSPASRSACPARVAMLELAHKEHGKLPWRELFQPAIDAARDGFAVPPRLAGWLQRMPSCDDPGIRAVYFNADGSPKKPGERIANPALAETMQPDRRAGRARLLRGRYRAPRWSSACAGTCGRARCRSADLADYKPIKREPVCGPYRVWIVCGMPPPSSGGIAILQVLGLLEPFELWRDKPDDLRALHLIAEASRLAFADRDRYVADPAFVHGARGRPAVAGLSRRAPQADLARPQHGRRSGRACRRAMSSAAPAT